MIATSAAAESVTLEDVLASEREDAAVLRRRGHAREADLIDGLLDRVVLASEDYVTWLDEGDAVIRSGRSAAWFRKHFAEWHVEGHARTSDRGARQYRKCIVPQRRHDSAAAEAGRRAGREDATMRASRGLK